MTRRRRHEEIVEQPQFGRLRVRLLSRGQLRSIEREIEDADLDAQRELVRRETGVTDDRDQAGAGLLMEKVLGLALVEPRLADLELGEDNAEAAHDLANDILRRSCELAERR